MSEAGGVVLVGAGHNGLVAACLLARAGLAPLVLERRPSVGGCSVTEELHPGFRCPTLSHGFGPFSPQLVRELGLREHGLVPIEPEVRLHALSLEGPAVTLHQDPQQTARALASHAPRDAARYPEFMESLSRIGRMLRPVLDMTPPALDAPSLREAWRMLRLGKSFRALGKKDAYRLLRWGPMAVADLVGEWFETELLRAAIAARGIHGAFAGPWSAGTALGVLFQAALDGHAVAPSASFRGGPGALAEALAAAARRAGATIRTGARVVRIRVGQGRATGVVLDSGEEISARCVVSGADPRATFLGLVDAVDLDPEFIQRVRNYRSVGTVAKLNYALAGLPAFGALAGRIHVAPSVDDLERAFDAAKYGEISARPYLDLALPSLADPSLAPAGAHVLSVHAQYAPASAPREELVERVEKVLVDYAPNFKGLVLARSVVTAADLEQGYGLSGGHILHGELTLDQMFSTRPLLGWARYRAPIQGLYLCGAGTHPGGGITGLSGRNAAQEILKDVKR